MSDETKTTEPELPALVKAAPELLPLWDWWVKEGRSTLIMVVIAAAVVMGFYGVRNWLRSRNAAANRALVTAFAADELEQAVADYGSTTVGPALRLRLAKAYYDAERYQDALDVYDVLSEKSDPAFVDIAVLGRAYSLEGLGKFKEAGEAFANYANNEANAKSWLILTAQLGAARCKALAGDKDGATKDFETLKANATDELAKMRIERMMDAVKRHDPTRAARSLFDAANAAAASVEAEKKTTEKPAAQEKPAVEKQAVPTKPAAEKPSAPAKPAAEKPATPAKPAPKAS